MGSRNGNAHWSVFDNMKFLPATPDALIEETNAAISALEYARATQLLNAPSSSSPSKSKRSDGKKLPVYDSRIADEAYKLGRVALADGKFDEALHSLNISLAKCPPERIEAVAKIQSLISLTSQQLQNSSI